MWSLIASLLAAAPVSPSAISIRFDEALGRVDAAGDLAGLAEAAQTRRAGVSRLGSLTSNPQLSVLPTLRSTDLATPAPEGILTLTQSFNLGGLASARKAVAREEGAAAAMQVRALRHERRIAVAFAWLDAWAAQNAAAIAHEEEGQAHELVVRIDRGLKTGAITRVELATARAFAAEAAALHLEWEGRRVEAGAQLSNLLGLEAIAVALGPLPSYPDIEPASLDGTGTLPAKLLQVELTTEQRRTEETKAQWASALQASVQAGHEAPNQWLGSIGLGLTLPVFEQGHREQVIHEANAQRLSGEALLAQRRANITRDVALHELEHSAETLTVVKTQQLPAAEEAAELEAQRFAMGEATLLELTLLRRQALAARIAATLAEARFVGARANAHELLETR